MAVSILGEAAVRLRPETTGFQGDAEKGILGPLGGIAKAGAGLFAAAFAGGAIVHGITSFYDAAEESAKIGRLTEQVIKSTGGAANLSADQVGNLVTAISNKTGVDDEAIQSGANLLLTFTNIKNAAGAGNDIFTQTTQIMTDMSAALGTDASGSAIQLGKALNDPVKGVTALQKVGVSFTESQKEQIKTLVASGDTLGAQKIILQELNKEFGGAAAAASSPMEKLKVNLGNVQEAIGGALLPAAANLAGFFVSTLLPAFSTLGSYAEQAYNILFKGDFTGGPLSEDSGVVDTLFNIRDGFIAFGQAVVDFVHSDTFATWVQLAKDAAEKLWTGLSILATFVTTVVVPAFFAVGKAIADVAVFFTEHSLAAQALGVVVGTIAALFVAAWAMGVAASIAGAATSVASWFAVAVGAQTAAEGTTVSMAQMVFGWVATAASAVFNAALVVASWVGMAASAAVNAVAVAAVWVAQTAVTTAGIISGWAVAIATTVAAWVGMAASAAAQAIAVGAVWVAQTAIDTAAVIASWAVSVATVVGGWIVMAATALVQAASMAAAWFIALGPIGWVIAAVVGLVALIIANWETVKTFTVDAFNKIVDAVKVAWQWVMDVTTTFVTNVISFVQGIPGRIVDALSALGSLIAGVATAAWQWFLDNVAAKVGEAVIFVSGLPGKIVSAVGNLGGLLVQKGKDLIQGLVDGIASAAGYVGGVARNIVNGIIGFINTSVIDGINNLLDFTIMGVHINPPDIPHIPRLHSGGVFESGSPTGEGLALLRDNELVVTPEQRTTAASLLSALFDGTLGSTPASPAAPGVTRGGDTTVNVYAAPGMSPAEVAAHVSTDLAFRASAGIGQSVTLLGAPS